MIVSSTSELRVLGVLVKRRLDGLALPLDADQSSALAGRMKKDALFISGDIVLRAAKRGVSAGEMIGLVLSRHLLEQEFKALAGSRQAFSVFFLLDDIHAWLPNARLHWRSVRCVDCHTEHEGAGPMAATSSPSRASAAGFM